MQRIFEVKRVIIATALKKIRSSFSDGFLVVMFPLRRSQPIEEVFAPLNFHVFFKSGKLEH